MRRLGLVRFEVVLVFIGLVVLAVVVGYVLVRSAGDPVPVAPDLAPVSGVAARGRELVRSYGCVTCHEVPGAAGVPGRVGPTLVGLEERALIAGRLPNTVENLVAWIMDPQAVSPGSGMPDMDVTLPDALDIAAFLYGGAGEE